MIHVFKYNTPEGLICLNVDNEVDAENLRADGALEVTAEELDEYGLTGKEHLLSPATTKIQFDGSIVYHGPSKEEQLAQLDAQYDSDKAELTQYFTDALLAGDISTQEDLKAELLELDADYKEQRKEIEEGDESSWQ